MLSTKSKNRMMSVLAMLAMLLSFVNVSPALAEQPSTEVTVVVDYTYTDSALCGFPIVYTENGTFKIKTYYDSEGNPVKLILLLVAGLNVYVFHRGIHREVANWDLDIDIPPRARIAGAVSLVTWALIVVAGRLIAYSWFNCEYQPQSAFINWFAGCVITP